MRKPTYSDTKENAKIKANSKGGLNESYPNAAIPYWPRSYLPLLKNDKRVKKQNKTKKKKHQKRLTATFVRQIYV